MARRAPWLGVLALFQIRGLQDMPYRAMVVCYEHHMKPDLTGYPRSVRPREQSIFSKIVAVADGFDAATSRRAYQTVPMSPAAVLAGMRDNPRRGFDQVIVKGFINLVGVYPVGTLVVLDTFELAIVHSVNPNPQAISRPVVRIVSDDRGNVLYPGELADLTEQTSSRRIPPHDHQDRSAGALWNHCRRLLPLTCCATVSPRWRGRGGRRWSLRHGRAPVPACLWTCFVRSKRRRRCHRSGRPVFDHGRRSRHPGQFADGARAGDDARSDAGTGPRRRLSIRSCCQLPQSGGRGRPDVLERAAAAGFPAFS